MVSQGQTFVSHLQIFIKVCQWTFYERDFRLVVNVLVVVFKTMMFIKTTLFCLLHDL